MTDTQPASTPNSPVTPAKSGGYGKWIACGCIAAVLLIICSCVGIVGGVFYASYSTFSSELSAIQNSAKSACEGRDGLSQSEYNSIFTSGFRGVNTKAETEEYLKTAFVQNYDCKDIVTSGFSGFMRSGQAVQYQTDLLGTRATLTLPVDGEAYVINLLKINDNWQVSAITTEKLN